MLSAASRLKDFPSLANRVYLNSAAEGIPPQQVLDSLNQYGQDKIVGMDGRLLHQEQWSQAREKVAKFLGFATEDIGICSCSSEAYNLLYLALALKEGDEVVVNDLDFPAGTTPWLHRNTGAVVKVWRSRDGILDTKDLAPLLSARTRLVNISLVSFYNGFYLDLDEVSQIVRARSNAIFAVDVTQALARHPLNLKNVDFVVSSTHKWMLGPHGGGLVAVNPERADELTAPAGGWFNLENAFDDSRFTKLNVKRGAASYMVGMPNYAAIYAINAALGYIDSIGVAAIEQKANALAQRCRDGIGELPVDLMGPVKLEKTSGIISFTHPDYERINNFLHQENIHVMSHAGRMRIAVHGYNDEADIDRFLETLQKALNV
ncbi:MAG: aminotransferase class V-fold PLP-dependent enzyme [Actinobacteria bacterium]|nr:aminotransferase class V-fold PLP-dependent enzyme [Actinomycetota bacterium]